MKLNQMCISHPNLIKISKKSAMIKPFNTIQLIGSVLILSACAGYAPKQPKASPPPQIQTENVAPVTVATSQPSNNTANNEESIADYINKILSLGVDAEKKELQDQNVAWQANKLDINTRTKLTLLYGLPSSKVRDSGKAQSLIEELLRENLLSNERKTMLVIMRDYLQESAKITQRIREEQKKSDGLQFKLDSVQQKYDAAQQKADSLQQKLDELKNIEKTMIDRSHTNKK